ncbi:aminoacyl-tRNA hydrolase [Acidimicrobiales bacterium]|nr:aminoacyl-tRNA hydrolase [Acidimicrobiales bacterium]MDC1389946.1 aminoacyl-tRNA hydrolase [Acidimicrobiales bacterium]
MALRRKLKQEPRRGTPADLLVVGLGNPGNQYEGTRHNIGVEVVHELVERYGGKLKTSREAAHTDELRVGKHRVAVAFPQTFMNRSGESVRLLMRRYGIEDLERLVVVHDELDLEPGRFKVKVGGGLAGHNGLKSIRDHVHSTDFVRLRIGVGKAPGRMQGADWVLKRPGKEDRQLLDEIVETAADAAEMLLVEPAVAVMNRFNT